ncbi:MAG: alkaline phosphatase family protein [Myxococcota bacterium]
MGRRMVVIGLDCAAPDLVFERYREAMPNLSALMDRGSWGRLRSSAPPITVPAWTCMLSGRDPGELGLYGFRNRIRGQTTMTIATGADVQVKRVWDWLGDHGFRVAPLFVPLTSPPRPVRGEMVAGFMWPGPPTPWCFPRSLEAELESQFGTYLADVEDFRATDYGRIEAEVHAMTRQHFAMAKHVWESRHPDFMMMVEIGVDRFHHAFWHHMDPTHPSHDPQSPWTEAGQAYYALVDSEIGKLLDAAGDETAVMVVSDHGARAMRGGFCLNDWLIKRGYLVLARDPQTPTPLRHEDVDWSRTTAWAEGGYYGRVFLNVRDREPHGVVRPSDAENLKRKLERELGALVDDDGRPIAVTVHDPETHYRVARGLPPDLMVYFEDLALRAIGSIGHATPIVSDNDTGPDTCNHDWDGIFVLAGDGLPNLGRIHEAEIYDVTATILAAFGVDRPPGVLGRDWTVARG